MMFPDQFFWNQIRSPSFPDATGFCRCVQHGAGKRFWTSSFFFDCLTLYSYKAIILIHAKGGRRKDIYIVCITYILYTYGNFAGWEFIMTTGGRRFSQHLSGTHFQRTRATLSSWDLRILKRGFSLSLRLGSPGGHQATYNFIAICMEILLLAFSSFQEEFFTVFP